MIRSRLQPSTCPVATRRAILLSSLSDRRESLNSMPGRKAASKPNYDVGMNRIVEDMAGSISDRRRPNEPSFLRTIGQSRHVARYDVQHVRRDHPDRPADLALARDEPTPSTPTESGRQRGSAPAGLPPGRATPRATRTRVREGGAHPLAPGTGRQAPHSRSNSRRPRTPTCKRTRPSGNAKCARRRKPNADW